MAVSQDRPSPIVLADLGQVTTADDFERAVVNAAINSPKPAVLGSMAPMPERTPALRADLDDLMHRASYLNNRFDKLIAQLEPVLNYRIREPEEVGSAVGEAPSYPAGEAILQIKGHLDQVHKKMNDLMDNLEV